MKKTLVKVSQRECRVICSPFLENEYMEKVSNPNLFREYIDTQVAQFPELFPPTISSGYTLKDIRFSVKLGIRIRRIKIDNTIYTVRPSFVMPYMTGLVDGDIEKALFLRKFSVPYWVLARTFGRNPMYWYRLECSLGRNSIVGTTVKDPNLLPKHLLADEKHSWIKGEKCYIATTVGEGCILGAAVAEDAGEQSLTKAYGVFKKEVECIKPDYAPETINTDGWQATQNALKALFASVMLVCCFLHIYIKMRDRAKKKFKDVFNNASSKLWDCYKATTRQSFLKQVVNLVDWARDTSLPQAITAPINKLSANVESYAVAYDFPGAHRTSSMLDKLMQRMDRHLFAVKYFHGSSISSAELNIRGWALIQNFATWNPRTIMKKDGGWTSPAEKLNRRRYHDCWLENLLISASLRGIRVHPPNP
jgi:hypothetical protein